MQAKAAHRQQEVDRAITLYEEWIGRVEYLTPPHPQINVVRSRLKELRDGQANR